MEQAIETLNKYRQMQIDADKRLDDAICNLPDELKAEVKASIEEMKRTGNFDLTEIMKLAEKCQ